MKKLNLKNPEFLLTRKEMKAFNGGYGGTCNSPQFPCNSDADCKAICERSVAYCANTNGVKNCQFCCN